MLQDLFKEVIPMLQAMALRTWYYSMLTDVGITAIAAATDFILSTLPIICLWNVQIKITVKLGICSVMMLGFA